MGLLRRKGFLAAVAMSAVLGVYIALVAGRAVLFLKTDDALARVLGAALLVMPAIGVWWLVVEWRHAAAVQRMADTLADSGALTPEDGERDEFGRLTPEAQRAAFEAARAEVEALPGQWESWFRMGYAYEANGDRAMARRSLRHAQALFTAQRASARR